MDSLTLAVCRFSLHQSVLYLVARAWATARIANMAADCRARRTFRLRALKVLPSSSAWWRG